VQAAQISIITFTRLGSTKLCSIKILLYLINIINLVIFSRCYDYFVLSLFHLVFCNTHIGYKYYYVQVAKGQVKKFNLL